jgi:hypothetical protein
MKTVEQALPMIERLDAQYWAADERHDWPERHRLGGLREKAWEAAKKLPVLSDADAARKLELAEYRLSQLGQGAAGVEISSRLKQLAAWIGASDTPRHRLKLLTDLDELQVCVSRLTEDGELDYDHILTDEVAPHIEAVIAWLSRSRVEHFPDEGVTVTYVAPGMVMVARVECAWEAHW